MHSIPRELDEAAVIDGSNPWQLFSRIIFPLLKPVTITVLVLNFMGAWNDFISPLYSAQPAKHLADGHVGVQFLRHALQRVEHDQRGDPA